MTSSSISQPLLISAATSKIGLSNIVYKASWMIRFRGANRVRQREA